ncbi:hypothetical protein ACJX0J_025195 [Zea mays]
MEWNSHHFHLAVPHFYFIILSINALWYPVYAAWNAASTHALLAALEDIEKLVGFIIFYPYDPLSSVKIILVIHSINVINKGENLFNDKRVNKIEEARDNEQSELKSQNIIMHATGCNFWVYRARIF